MVLVSDSLVLITSLAKCQIFNIPVVVYSLSMHIASRETSYMGGKGRVKWRREEYERVSDFLTALQLFSAIGNYR